MSRRRAPALLMAVSVVAFALPCAANEIDWGDGVEVLERGDMEDLRGGFMVLPGLQVHFGAVVTTFLDDAPVLQTQLTWGEAGSVVERSIGALGQQIDTLSPHERAALGLEGLEGAGGLVISDAQGVTALVHNVTDGALQNIVLNNASGRDLRQEIDITLTLPGFEAIQDALDLERLGLRIDADMRSIQVGG